MDVSAMADCGSVPLLGKLHAFASAWNVLVRGDSVRATVRASARFIARAPAGQDFDCSSTGAWETAIEGAVRAGAEGHTSTVTGSSR